MEMVLREFPPVAEASCASKVKEGFWISPWTISRPVSYTHLPVEKLMRDVKVFQIFEGTNQIQRMTIANVLNKEYK